MKRLLTILLAFALVLSGLQLYAEETRSAKIVELYGTVTVKRAASEKNIKAFKNMRLDEGDTVSTGKDSKVVFQVDDDKKVTLAASTVIVISELTKSENSTDTTISLKTGGVGSKIDKKLDKDSSYKIKTPTAVMGVRGTEFYVQMRNNKVDVWLTEGTIEMDYRVDIEKLEFLGHLKGEPKKKILTAPKKYEFGELGTKFEPTEQKFEIKGLYKEFLTPDNLKGSGLTSTEILAGAILAQPDVKVVEPPTQIFDIADRSGYSSPTESQLSGTINLEEPIGTIYINQLLVTNSARTHSHLVTLNDVYTYYDYGYNNQGASMYVIRAVTPTDTYLIPVEQNYLHMNPNGFLQLQYITD